jgi:hypothetical protein
MNFRYILPVFVKKKTKLILIGKKIGIKIPSDHFIILEVLFSSLANPIDSTNIKP